jgi:hypothetical protein
VRSLLGLELEKALKMAEEAGFKPLVVRYHAKAGEVPADSEIVIRQRQKEDRLELVVSAFKTALF